MSDRHFFATASDLLPGLTRFEQTRSIRYIQSGLFDTRQVQEYLSGTALPHLGVAPSGHAIGEPTFLVLDRDKPLVIRDVPQLAGGIKYGIDQLENPDSTVLWPGGLCGPDILISGRIATTGFTSVAKELQRVMVRTVTKGFVRVRAFWLGPEALRMFERGARLTMATQMPPAYDLRRENAG